ncbi:MAG: IS1595 family transposase, partial [Campylobacteraceae bacterium]|nr:IS1595 family transposase [Campylobacteraceae bacterium]
PLGGLLKRNGNVYTQVVKNCSKKELEPLILKHTGLGTVYSDKWAAYDSLVNYKVKEHHRINHGADEFASNHINAIESFPAYAKLRLSKFKDIKRQNFILHLKECEFRFNNRDKKGAELYKILLKMIRENPLRLIDPFRIPSKILEF